MSTNRRIYLDFNATAPLVPAARDAMVEAMSDTGNPSSVHAEGRRLRDRVERARNQVATLVGRPREQVVFTSGGTEANWLGVMGLAAAAEQRGLPRVVATTPIEHPSLRGAIDALCARGWTRAPHASELPRELGLLACSLVNHELGTLFAADTLREAGATRCLVHLDAVQAAGKLALDGIVANSIAISGHKIGGPQGVGAVVIDVDAGLPINEAGHQERGRRPGTENTLGIVGFGAAAATIDRTDGDMISAPTYKRLARWTAVYALGEQLARGLAAIEHARFHADHAHTIGGTLNVGFAGARGESIVVALDLEGIAVSTGAACTSGSIQPSAVLVGLGFSNEQAAEAVRFSLGPTTTEGELNHVLKVLPDIVERARRHR